MVKDRTGKLNGIFLTAIIISYALFPPRPESVRDNSKSVDQFSSGFKEVRGNNIRFYMADLNRAIDGDGELKLLFPGCFVLAAPVLLYRLKRNGFSNGRVICTAQGLLLTATR